jgi:hypothetical protein
MPCRPTAPPAPRSARAWSRSARESLPLRRDPSRRREDGRGLVVITVGDSAPASKVGCVESGRWWAEGVAIEIEKPGLLPSGVPTGPSSPERVPRGKVTGAGQLGWRQLGMVGTRGS